MEKLEFEEEIKKVLIKAGFMKENQIVSQAIITLTLNSLPEVDLSFLLTDENGKN